MTYEFRPLRSFTANSEFESAPNKLGEVAGWDRLDILDRGFSHSPLVIGSRSELSVVPYPHSAASWLPGVVRRYGRNPIWRRAGLRITGTRVGVALVSTGLDPRPGFLSPFRVG